MLPNLFVHEGLLHIVDKVQSQIFTEHGELVRIDKGSGSRTWN